MKNIVLAAVLLFLPSFCFSTEIMVVFDNQTTGTDTPQVEQFFLFLKTVVFSEMDKIGLVRAGEYPVLVYPPTGNGYHLASILSKELSSPVKNPDLAKGVAFAAQQLDAYYPEETGKQLFVITAGGGNTAGVSRPQNMDAYVYYMGDVPADYKNSLKGVLPHSYDVKTLADIQGALVSHLFYNNSAYREKASFIFDERNAVLKISLGNIFEKIFLKTDEVIVFTRAIMPLRLEEIQLNMAFIKNGETVDVDGSRAAFNSVNLNRQEYSALRIISPKTTFNLTFLPGTKITDVQVISDTRVNWLGVLISTVIGTGAIALIVLVLHSRYKPLWEMEIKNNAGRVCKVFLAKAASKKAYGPGSLKNIIKKENDKTDVSTLGEYTIKVQGGTWKLLEEKKGAEDLEIIGDFANEAVGTLKGSFKVFINHI